MLAEQARIALAHAAPGRDREGGHGPGLDQASFVGSARVWTPRSTARRCTLPELVSRLPSLRLGGRARELVTPFFLEGLTSLPAGWELEAPVIVVQP